MISQTKNILTLVLIAFALSIQVWLISIFALQHYPPANVLTHTIVPEWWYFIIPERDALHYHIFVFAALGMTAVVLWRLSRYLTDTAFIQKARLFLTLETIWTFFLLSAAFKMTVYAQRPELASRLFWSIVIVSFVGRIFFTELSVLLLRAYHYLNASTDRLILLVEIAIPVLLISILYIPDVRGVMARDFLGEQFHHWDSAVMAPAWAYLSGSILNVDVISQYGLGLPIFIADLAKFFGGFTYENVLRVMVWGNIIYFLGWYFLLRYWLKSPAIAAAGILFAIKIQMFNVNTYPIVFTYPSDTIFRYALDVVFFTLMLGHLKSGRLSILLSASAVCGIAVFYMTTTGISMTLTWLTYLAGTIIFPDLRRKFYVHNKWWLVLPACLGGMLTAVFGSFRLAEGRHIFTAEFWHNMQEFNNYFLNGFGDIPLQQNIADHNYQPLLMGLLIPLVYMITFLIVSSLYFYKKCTAEDLLAAFIAFYGLVLYHYFMARPTGNTAYGIGLPFAFLLAFWLERGTRPMIRQKRRHIILACTALAMYALVTNYNYVSYPNIFNLSRNPLVDPLVFNPLPDGRSYFNHLFSQLPMDGRLPTNSLGTTDERLRSEKDFAGDKDLREFYDQEFDFSRDAGLIDALVPPQGKVALISSFETKILMDADRAAFFYYIPLVISRPMHMRTMAVTALYTQGHLQRTIGLIEAKKPLYIFIERIFNKENIDMVNYQDGSAFLSLMRYVHAHYEKYRDGYFLMALKRKDFLADKNQKD